MDRTSITTPFGLYRWSTRRSVCPGATTATAVRTPIIVISLSRFEVLLRLHATVPQIVSNHCGARLNDGGLYGYLKSGKKGVEQTGTASCP